MMRPWIKAEGVANEAELRDLMEAFRAETPGTLVLAAYPDRYTATRETVSTEKLLELRVFHEEAELWARRTALCQDFTWRIADDRTLAEAVGQADLMMYRIEETQKLDIDTQHPPKGPAPEGCRMLRTTGGMPYALPIQDENAILLAIYLDDDEEGRVRITDFRPVRFVRDPRFTQRED